MGPDNLYCGKWRKISKSRLDLKLGSAAPNIELVPHIFVHYNVSQFHVPRSNYLSYRTKTRKHRNTHTDSDKCSIVVFCKNATLTRKSLRFCFTELAFIHSHLLNTEHLHYKTMITEAW